MSNAPNRKWYVLLLMITVLAISIMPISISAPTYVTCYTDVWFNSAPDGRDGPVMFNGLSTFTELFWSNETFSPTENHRFTNFRQCIRAAAYAEPLMGLNIDDNANATVIYIRTQEIQIHVNRTGPATAENYIYLPNRPIPTNVTFSNGGAWAWNNTASVCQFNTTHTSMNVVTFRWGGAPAPTPTLTFGFSSWFSAYSLMGVLLIASISVLVMTFLRGNMSLSSAMAVVVLAIVIIIGLSVLSMLVANLSSSGVNIT